jgi:hypothetical protein
MLKLTITVFAILIQYQMIKCQDNVCNQAESSGFCRAMIEKYYYDTTRGECKQFVYGGCGGNQNRFDTIDECMKTCYVGKNKCKQQVDIGPCRAQIPRYFYNKETSQCELFIFGGCNPNQNNFESYEICMKTCF